jgi:cell division protein FtsB
MTENKAKIYSILIKIAIGIVFSVLIIVLLYQYITLGKLNNKYDSLSNDYTALQAEKTDLEKQQKDIEDNYEEYVTDYARDKFNYTDEDEILFNK